MLDDLQLELEKSPDKEDGQEIKGQLSVLKQYIESIHNHGVRMDKIVLGMLNHTTISGGERVLMDIQKLVDESIDLAFYGFKGRFPDSEFLVVRDYESGQLMAQVYPNELSKSLINIFDNACYAIHEKVKTSEEGYQPTVKVRLQSHHDHICIRVWDNGNGIAPEGREKIFTPFYTTKPTGAGNIGLGLSIAYDVIVKGHHGRLFLESEPGSFTAFIIELPIDEKE